MAATLTFEQWKKQKQKIQNQIDTGSTLSFDDWKKAKKLGIESIETTPTAAQPMPKTTTQFPSLFTKQDPQIILNTLMGFVPGAQEAKQTITAQSPQERLQAARELQNKVSLGNMFKELVKGVAGIPIRAGLSVSDLFSGPKQANIPLLGQQQSYQETARQVKGQGGGVATTIGVPAVQMLFDVLMGKGAIEGLKPKPKVAEVPIEKPIETSKVEGTKPKPPGYYLGEAKTIPEGEAPTNQQLAQRYLQNIRQKTVEKPAEIMETKDNFEPILEKLVRPAKEKSTLLQKKEALARLNPYQFESGKLESMGLAGKEIVTRGRRANATSIFTAGELRQQIKQTGINKLTEPEQINLRAVLENKTTPINDNIAQLAKTWRETFNKYGAETDTPMIENYFPRRLNEAGKKFYENLRNKDLLVEEVMKQRGLDKVNAIRFVDRSLRRGSFEFERVLPDLPDEYRLKPIDELYQWATDVSRRKGVIQNFGKKNEIINNVLADLGRGNKNEFKMKQQAQDYVNRIMGKNENYSDLDPIYNILKQGMVVSKINPTTTLANALQGTYNSWLQYGVKGLKDAIFGKGGDALIQELGVKELKGRFGEEMTPESLASRWMGAMGMTKTEITNYAQAAQSTNGAITKAFEILRKDPANITAKKLLNDHAMYIDDTTLAKDLLNGKMSDFERKIGIVEGIRQKIFFSTPGERPAWANTGAGAVAYTFKSYILNQLQLLSKAPPERQLAYMMALAPLTGLPIMVLRKAIQGKPLPDNLADWYTESVTAGPGTAFDILKSLNINPVSFVAGGFFPLVDIATSKNKLKSAITNLPLQSWYLNRLFPPKK